MPEHPSEPWTWEEYDAYLRDLWPKILEDHADDEAEVQRFLEQHPCMIPGAEGGDSSIGGHHGPFPAAVITQPPMKGLVTKVPDFLWITKVSGIMRPVLIEIEAPAKRWFNQASTEFDAKLKNAMGQVAQWRDWLEDPENRLIFYRRFKISEALRDYFKIEPKFSLIYGRRDEFAQDKEKSRLREAFRPSWLEWQTFDRLKPLYGASNWVTVRYIDKEWRVIAVPPTFSIYTETESHVEGLIGLDEAIKVNDLIADVRKDRLLEAISTWPTKRNEPYRLHERLV